MSNKNNNMRQVYFRRRLVAIIILVVVLLLIFRACSRSPEDAQVEDVAAGQGQTSGQTDQSTSQSQRDPVVQSPRNQDEFPPTRSESDQDDQEEDSTTTDTEGDDNDQNISPDERQATKEVALETQLEDMRDDYVDYASIEYNELDNAIEFELEGDFKDQVDDIFSNDATSSDQDQWDDFKDEIIKSSQTITEEIEPGIEFKVINPGGMTEVILSVKDGSVSFDLVSD